jgi:hypothetical protein
MFSVLYHLRRRHRRPKRSISGKYPALPSVRLDQVGPSRRGLRLCRGCRLVRLGLWDLERHWHHRFLWVRVDRLGRVVRQVPWGRGHREYLECRQLERRDRLVVHRHLDYQVGRVVLVGLGRRVDRLCLRCLVGQLGLDCRVVLVVRALQLCLVRRACTVVA